MPGTHSLGQIVTYSSKMYEYIQNIQLELCELLVLSEKQIVNWNPDTWLIHCCQNDRIIRSTMSEALNYLSRFLIGRPNIMATKPKVKYLGLNQFDWISQIKLVLYAVQLIGSTAQIGQDFKN